MKLTGGLGLLVTAPALAQSPGDQSIPPVTYPIIAQRAATPTGFVPKGWVLEAKADGDLNADKRNDAVLVLHMNDPKNFVPSDWDPNQKYDSNPRMLVVAFARNGGYELVAADNALIPRLENQNQDDPFDGVSIRDGTLRIKMHIFMSAGGWWMGAVGYTFRWQAGHLKLIGYERDGVQRNTGETDRVSINYLTRTKLAETGNIDGSTGPSRRERLPAKPLLDLTKIGDGLMFYPDER